MTTVATLSAKLMNLLGSTGASASSLLLETAIESALDDLARFQPRIVLVQVPLIPGVSEYLVPGTPYNVLDVVFPEYSQLGYPYSEGTYFAPLTDGTLSEFHSHSLAVLIAQRWEQFYNKFGYEWEYDIDTQRVRVMPMPQTTSTMLLMVAEKRTLEQVPIRLMQAVEDLALAETLRRIAMTVGAGITSIPIGIGSVSFNAATLTQQADLLRKAALKRLGHSTGGGEVFIG